MNVHNFVILEAICEPHMDTCKSLNAMRTVMQTTTLAAFEPRVGFHLTVMLFECVFASCFKLMLSSHAAHFLWICMYVLNTDSYLTVFPREHAQQAH